MIDFMLKDHSRKSPDSIATGSHVFRYSTFTSI